MRLYKLTTQDGKTRAGESNETQWGENITHEALGSSNQDLCSNGWIHAYTSIPLALLLNPIHASISDPLCWEGRGIIGKRDGALKVGCRKFTTLKIVRVPFLSTNQRVAFGIFCALEVYKNERFRAWAFSWLKGQDRSAAAAYAYTAGSAYTYAYTAAAAAQAAAAAADADAAADAAAAAAAAAQAAADAAADAAAAAYAAADAAAYAAADANPVAFQKRLPILARRAMNFKG